MSKRLGKPGSSRVLAGVIALATVAAVPPVLADSSPLAHAAAKRVVVGDNFFRPRSSTIRRGGTVRWAWRGHNRHNVVFVSGRRRPRACRAQRRGSCTRRFRRAGSYRYICVFHPNMRGTIRVRR